MDTSATSSDLAVRLQAQRHRLFQAMSTLSIVNKVLEVDGEVGDDVEAGPLWFSVEGVVALLNDIAHQLEPAVICV